MGKRLSLAALCAVLLSANICAEAAENSAVSAILVDAASGRVLYEKNAHEPRLIASITKLMTALVAVESTPDLSAVVTVKPEWLAGAEGSSIYLAAGEEITLEALLYGMLLNSGNDAAQVVAGYCGGDIATFVDWMNLRAEDLGMTDSHFANPSGLNAGDHYSSAYDMALCAMACMDNEVIAKIVATKSITFGTHTFTNHNKLLTMYDGCIGMKTGYTELAGRTLVSCAERDGQRLIAVTLSDPNDWEDHMALYEYGFANYPLRTLCTAGETVRRQPITGSLVRFVGVTPIADLTYPMADDEEPAVFWDISSRTAAPVQEGGIAGRLEFYVGQTRVGAVYLVYTSSANRDLFAQQPLLERILTLVRGTPQEEPVAEAMGSVRLLLPQGAA